MFERAILHLNLDTFFVSVERLRYPALCGKPVLITGHAERGIVSACSVEAQRYGIHTAMPVRTALLRCPDAVLLRGDLQHYEAQAKVVANILELEAPLVERSAPGQFYADLSGMDRYVGCWQWTRELRRKINHETGLPLSACLAVNKLVSRVGARQAQPNGECMVEAGTERFFLAPLPVGQLPGVAQPTARKLSMMGVRRVKTLSEVPPPLLECEFGPLGPDLWRKANAIDDSPVLPYQAQAVLSAEHVFDIDTVDIRQLHDQLSQLVMQLAFALRRSGKLAAGLSLKLRYADANTYSRRQRIPLTAADGHLLRYAHELLEALFVRRQLVRAIGLSFTHLAAGYEQMSLFEDTPQDVHLQQALDRLRLRFGTDAVRLGSSF